MPARNPAVRHSGQCRPRRASRRTPARYHTTRASSTAAATKETGSCCHAVRSWWAEIGGDSTAATSAAPQVRVQVLHDVLQLLGGGRTSKENIERPSGRDDRGEWQAGDLVGARDLAGTVDSQRIGDPELAGEAEGSAWVVGHVDADEVHPAPEGARRLLQSGELAPAGGAATEEGALGPPTGRCSEGGKSSTASWASAWAKISVSAVAVPKEPMARSRRAGSMKYSSVECTTVRVVGSSSTSTP